VALASAQVVDKVAALLAAGATSAGARVYTSRFWPLARAELPAMRVYADDERIERVGIDYPWLQQHSLLVLVDAFVVASADLDDAMHNLVESTLGVLFGTQAAAQLSPLVGCDMQAAGIEREVEQLGGADVGRVRLTLQINFHTASNAPGTLT
jgi:hypothetical protein